MGIDFKKMRQKLLQLQNKGSGSANAFWRPQEGDNNIRIIPTADGDPFKEYWFHYNVGKNPGFLCPKKNFGKSCPCCDFAWHIMGEAKETNDVETLKLAKSLLPRQRYFSPVLVRGEEDAGVKVWGYGKMAYKELLDLVLNPDYGDITDVADGTDLVLNYGKPPGASFPQTKLQPRRRTSPMVKEGAESSHAKNLLDSIPEFKGLFLEKTGDEIETMLNEFLSGKSEESDAEDSSNETTKYNTNKNFSNSGSSKVDDAFNELLG